MSSCLGLNRMVPVKSIGDLRWYSGLHYERDVERGILRFHNRLTPKSWRRSTVWERVFPSLRV